MWPAPVIVQSSTAVPGGHPSEARVVVSAAGSDEAMSMRELAADVVAQCANPAAVVTLGMAVCAYGTVVSVDPCRCSTATGGVRPHDAGSETSLPASTTMFVIRSGRSHAIRYDM